MNGNLLCDWLAFWNTEECKNFEDCTNCKFDKECCNFQKFLNDNHITKSK